MYVGCFIASERFYWNTHQSNHMYKNNKKLQISQKRVSKCNYLKTSNHLDFPRGTGQYGTSKWLYNVFQYGTNKWLYDVLLGENNSLKADHITVDIKFRKNRKSVCSQTFSCNFKMTPQNEASCKILSLNTTKERAQRLPLSF